jgi:hypothetical protein
MSGQTTGGGPCLGGRCRNTPGHGVGGALKPAQLSSTLSLAASWSGEDGRGDYDQELLVLHFRFMV